MFLEYLITIIIISLFVLFVNYLLSKTHFWRTINEIPGLYPLPVIGNLLTMLNCRTREELFNFLRNMTAQYGETWKIKMLHIGSISISNPDDIEIILSSSKHIDKGEIYKALQPWLCFGLLTSTGEKWHNRRKILTPAFHFNILRQFMPIFVENTDNLIEQLKGECSKTSTDVSPFIIETTLQSICETAMGTKLDKKDTFQKKYIEAIHRLGEVVVKRILQPWMYFDWLYHLTPLGWEEAKLTKLLHNFSKNIIKGRQVNFTPVAIQETATDDVYRGKRRLAMLDLLLTAKSEGAEIDDEGIREEVDTFMFEGHDTTSTCLCFTLMLLANHPDVQTKLLQEIDEVMGRDKWPPTYQELQQLQYMERCIKESLRLYPSVHYIARQINEEVQIKSGYKIPSGCLVHIQIYDLHRNPKIYPEPAKFDPDRFLPEATCSRHSFAYIPFSAGPRNCIGQRFAFLEMKIVLSGILRNLSLLPADKPDDLIMGVDFILRSKNGIKVQFKQRDPTNENTVVA